MNFGWDEDNMMVCLLVTVLMQLSFFLVAATLQFDKVTDFAGGTNFLLLALLTFNLESSSSTFEGGRQRQLAVTICVSLWAIRLSGFPLYRILTIGKDRRFNGTRENWRRFLVFWILQMIWVFVVSLPLIFINSSRLLPSAMAFPSTWDVCGLLLFLVGFLLETVADFQKFAFKEDPVNSDKWCQVGLWKYSRHPNYFGEMVVWWGIFLVGVSVYGDEMMSKFVAVLSPLFTMAILLFLSGLPLLERRADKRFGSRLSYREYKKSVSPLVPLPPQVYRRLPNTLKTWLLCELPLYNRIN